MTTEQPSSTFSLDAPVAAPADATTAKLSKTTARGKKRQVKVVSTANVYVQASYNNTLVTFTDLHGNSLGQASAGSAGFKGPKKSTPYAASVIVRQVVERIRPYGVKEVHVYVKGVGAGRESAVRALNANGINVLGIKDITPIPHNGCRRKKPRRV